MWSNATVTVNEQDYRVMFKGDTYQFPASAGIEVGDIIKIDSRSYQVVALSMFRDEGLIAKVEEVKDGKPKARRARNKSSGQEDVGEDDT